MKHILTLLLALTTLGAFAQNTNKGGSKPHKTPEERATAYANRMEKELTLTAEQKTKVHDLALTRAQKMDQLREQYKGQDKKVWQAERKKARDEFHAGMKSVLSPEQFTKWEEQQKKKAAQSAKGKAKGKGKAKQTTGTGSTTTTTTDGEEGADTDLDGE